MFVFVFVRNDLSPKSQIAVQASHATLKASHTFDMGKLKDHPNLVMIGVSDIEEFSKIMTDCFRKNINYVCFHESDLNNQLTAIATEPITKSQKKVFANMKLLKIE